MKLMQEEYKTEEASEDWTSLLTRKVKKVQARVHNSKDQQPIIALLFPA